MMQPVPNSVDLADALCGSRAGDEAAIATLFQALHPQLLRYVRHQAPDVCEDLVAETWLAAARLLPDFEGDVGDFRALLFSIARRRVVDHYRARARRPVTVELDGAPQPVEPDPAEAVVAALSSDQAVEALLRGLPPDQAEVVLMRVVGDLSADEVAAVTQRTAGAVRVLQHRALRRLARAYETRAVTR
jgi:RNA polymerase sigma-70 factor (ECF subfamily)